MRVSPSRWLLRLLLLAGIATGVVLGADALRILVDDAFITFRYVANAREGHGLVWNAPPFLPVEGYTSFLWAMLLWLVWSWFGVEPPHAANTMSIGLGLVSLAIVAATVFRLRLRDGRYAGEVVAFTTLAVIAGNRTFLQWLTSGLETALFNVCLLAWVVLGFRGPGGRSTRWLAAWATAASLAALTRPDGMLAATATIGVAGLAALRRERSWAATAIGLAPLLAVLTHVAWRCSFYGEWLPNTYHAKVGAPWPEAGVRYLACFGLEHGVWLWLVLAGCWIGVELARGRQVVVRTLAAHVPAVAVVCAVTFHVGYYTLRVGGDHFEYRMMSHLVPALALSAAAMIARITASRVWTTGCLVAFGIASSFGWMHLALTEWRIPPNYDPLSAHVPAPVRPIARWYDRQRLWLQWHFVCVRFLHGQSLEAALSTVPPRQRTPHDANDIPVARFTAVGMLGWVLPDVAIVDELGLNDWVVARNKPEHLLTSLGPLLRATVGGADTDGDGLWTRTELRTATLPLPGQTNAIADSFVDSLLLLFGDAANDHLTRSDIAAADAFFAELRLMVHECAPPPGYVAAFDPNVTVDGPRVAVRRRDRALTPDAVRTIEADWRRRMRER